MSTSKKTPAQLDREVAEVLASRAVERRSPTTASDVVKKLLSKARRLISDQRTDDLKLRDPGRSLARLSDIATEAIDAAEGNRSFTVRLRGDLGHAVRRCRRFRSFAH